MHLSAPIRASSLFGWLLVLAWCGARVSDGQPTRCMALCLRSETEDSCQRCRLRVPMRFGKRMDTSNGRLRIPMRFGKRSRDDNEEAGSALELPAPASVVLESRRLESSPVRRNNNLDNSDIPENWFFRVLNEPSLAYDNPSDYDTRPID